MNDFLASINIDIKPVETYSPLSLAYIGDAVYELYVRTFILSSGNEKPHALHKRAVLFVKAKSQADILKVLYSRFDFTPSEEHIIKWGRNANSGTVPKNANMLDYRHATALECLIGYLYMTASYKRLFQLLDCIKNIISTKHLEDK